MSNERHPFDAGPTRREFIMAATAAAGLGAWWMFGRGRPPAAGVEAAFAAGPRTPAILVPIADFSPAGVPAGLTSLPKVSKPEQLWKRQLTRLEFNVLREFQDEMAFSGAHWNNHDPGIYRCAACGTAAFGSADKFDSGTGWPGFTQPLAGENVRVGPHGNLPNAITCARCDSFLGDLFDDGPGPRGQRWCINSAAIRFVPADTPRVATAVLAGGCFWGVDAVFKRVRGVSKVVSGYAGGSAASAHYGTVSSGSTGHAESVEVTFDPATIAYRDLLRIFFLVAHDPTQLNRQGPDVGPQYRSAIFHSSDAQRADATWVITMLDRNAVFRKRIVTEVAPLDRFYPAEEYHQDYLARHMSQPYIVYNDLPKLERLAAHFPEWHREVGASR